MSEYLSPAELHALTGAARGPAQAEWLTAQAIPHKLDGKRVIVSREHVRAWLEGVPISASAHVPQREFTDYVMSPTLQVVKAGEYHPTVGTGVYMLFNSDGLLVYIGKSVNIGYRVVQHYWAMQRGEQLKFCEYAAIEVPGELMEPIEVAHIYALQPPGNTLMERIRWEHHDKMVTAIKEAWNE